MFLKIIGCLAILTASSGYGLAKGLEYKRQVEEMSAIERIIWQLRGEITYMKAPLPDVFRRVGGRLKNPYREWLYVLSEELKGCGKENFQQIWERVTREKLRGISLPKSEWDELLRLGGQMRYLDIRMQEMALDWYGNQMQGREAAMREVLEQKRKLFAYLGVMGGAFLVILLI
ncbi:stage III sporulation protein AB [Roseburia hominis]